MFSCGHSVYKILFSIILELCFYVDTLLIKFILYYFRIMFLCGHSVHKILFSIIIDLCFYVATLFIRSYFVLF